MKLQDQVITIEQAKRLKELAIDGESAFSHFKAASHSGICLGDIGNLRHVWALTGIGYDREDVEFIPAFTVAELGVMLPTSPKPEGGINYSYYHRNNWRGHSIGYSAPADPKNNIERPWFQNEAEARADLLIYLLEKAIITPEEANARLLK